MLRPNFEKKSSHCQQQAINTLQNIFPSVNLSQFSKSSSVWEALERSAKNLPRPGLSDITSAIENMKTVVDSQQLKIQKNMIEIEKQQEIIMSSKKSYTKIQSSEEPTAVKLNFHSQMQEESEELIHAQVDMEVYEKYEVVKKNEFFSEPEEIDYFQHHEDLKNPFDDEEDVKKYLSFDF